MASLGIGGLAVALASQSILVDTFASFTLFIDRPFSVGDKILINNNYTGLLLYQISIFSNLIEYYFRDCKSCWI